MKTAVILALLSLCARAQNPGPSVSGSLGTTSAAVTFAHYYAITTAASGSANLTAFPVCVNTGATGNCAPLNIATNLAASIVNTVSSGSPATQTGEPADAVITATAPGGSTGAWTCPSATYIPWETESYSAGSWIFFAQLPTYHSAGGDIIYICFGQASVTTQQNTGSVAPSAVWDSNYLLVTHLANITGGLVDSTSHAVTITNGSGTNGTGQINGGVSFAAATTPPAVTSAIAGPSNITVEAWALSTNVGSISLPVNVQPSGTLSLDNFQLGLAVVSSKPRFLIFSGTSQFSTTGATAVTNSTWHHIVGTYNGTNLILYEDGVSATSTPSVTMNTNTAAASIGGLPSNTDGIIGTVDEVRISNVARSSSYVTDCFNNTKASSTFLSAGSQQ